MPSGAAVSYVSGGAPRPLPAPSLTPSAHRPWCSDCKRKFDPDKLDGHGLCAKCAHAAETRAAAAERRAADPSCDKVWADAKKTKVKAEPAFEQLGRRQPSFDVDAAMLRYAAGETAQSIADDLGVKKGTIHRHASLRGIRSGQDRVPSAPASEEVPERVPPVATPAPPRVRARVGALGKSEVLIKIFTTDGSDLDPVVTSALMNDLLAGLQGEVPKKRRPAASPKVRKVRTRNGPERIALPSPDVEEAYAAGETLGEIAARLGVSAPTVSRHLEAHGVARRRQRVTYTPELLDQVKAEYAAGKTMEEVAADLDLTYKIVATALHRAGVEITRHGPRTDNAAPLKQQLAELGVTSREVKQWALAHGLVDRILRGIPSRSVIEAYAAAHPSAISTRSPTSASPASVGVSDTDTPTPQMPQPERTSA